MSHSSVRTVGVVGGGITGLVAAFRLKKLQPRTRVVILEADDRIGGKILTHEVAGVPIEAGADWFVTRQPAALELVHELGLDGELVTPSRSGAYVWSRKKLRRLPPDLVRGVPPRPLAAARAGLLSPQGAVRANRDLLTKEPLTGPDISIGELVRRRLGDEVMERLVDPMLAASRSGSADDMSLAVAAPELDHAARSNKSLLRGLRTAHRQKSEIPPFYGLRGGMGRLVDALQDGSTDVEIRTNTRVTAVRHGEGGGYLLDLDGENLKADGVLVAVPAPAAAAILRPLDPNLSDSLTDIRYSPAIVLTLVYPTGAGAAPAEGSGMLVPSTEARLLTACAWFSEKWEHARPSDGSLVLRCFVGRQDALAMEDEELVSGVAYEIKKSLRLAGPPNRSHVKRWDAALPVYRVGHAQLMDAIEEGVALLPGLELAGAGYRGSGLPDCISQGNAAARALEGHLVSFSS